VIPQIIVLPRARTDSARACNFINSLPLDKPWRVTVEQYKPRRSDQQNRFLWGYVYKTICEHLPGWTADDVHDFCLGECYGWETVEGLGRKRLRPVQRSSKMNKQDFADYISWIQQRMAEHGILIDDPDQQVAA
jgi:hypothetical protein